MAKSRKKPKTQQREKAETSVSSFSDGLRYPWGMPKRLLNILWWLIPFIGGFALIGYSQSTIRAIVAGNKSNLPEFIGFKDNLKNGFRLFVKALPLLIAYTLVYSLPGIGMITGWIACIFFLPYLTLNLFVTDKFEESFNIKKAYDEVFHNIEEYLMAFLKTLGFIIIYLFLSIILIGIPCLAFGHVFFLAEFYSNHN